jgi:mRNA-degrading endonuclease RelE of RelBE toxin-antitoxin system
VKALQGRSPWLRLRVGDHRILYRPVEPAPRWWVERIIHRGELEKAVGSL